MKQLVKPIIASLLMASAISAEAVIISLSPLSQNITVGEQISLDVFYDTEGEETVGGAFSINFNNDAFNFVSVTFDSTLPDDPFFRASPDQVNSNTFNLGFGNFNYINGAGRAATLLFQSVQEGSFAFTPEAPLPGSDPFQGVTNIRYDGAQVNVTPAPVPLPATAWLLMSGISGLGLFARRKRVI